MFPYIFPYILPYIFPYMFHYISLYLSLYLSMNFSIYFSLQLSLYFSLFLSPYFAPYFSPCELLLHIGVPKPKLLWIVALCFLPFFLFFVFFFMCPCILIFGLVEGEGGLRKSINASAYLIFDGWLGGREGRVQGVNNFLETI